MGAAFPTEACKQLRDLLSLSGNHAAGNPAPTTLGQWQRAWRMNFPEPLQALEALAAHDLRMQLHGLSGIPLVEITSQFRITDALPATGKRAAWESIRSESDWDLPAMALPAWAQTLFGISFIAGFVMPFIDPIWGLLVLPVMVRLSFILENRSQALPYPTLESMARRMVLQNKPGVELGKFAPEDLERMFFQLAEMASGLELDVHTWEEIPLPGEF